MRHGLLGGGHRGLPRALACLTASALVAAAIASGPAIGDGETPRPRVGLVLSGGGARGAVHVGVLKVLERERIPVEFIVGTSMGAVVGAMHAAGYNVEEIEREMLAIDWAQVFEDRPPRERIPFRRKQDESRAFFELEFGLASSGIRLASGLIAGQNLEFELKRLLLHTTVVEDFDELPIPFRAVATDVNTGEVAVLARGDLADAVRASMAVPGAFTPIEIDGRLLIDGGILMSLPVSVARSAGVDRIIAVDVSTPLRELTRDASVFEITTQAFLASTATAREQQRRLLADGDVLLRPDLEGMRTMDFDRLDRAIAAGEAAASASLDALSALAMTPEAYRQARGDDRAFESELRDEIVVDEVQIRGVRRVDTKLVKARLNTKPGETLDLDDLQRDLRQIYEIGEFEKVGFRLERGEDERRRLVVETREKPWGPRYLRFGIELESDFQGTGDFSLIGDFRWTQIGPRGAEWKIEGAIGNITGLGTEFYQPLDYRGLFFIEPRLEYFTTRTDLAGPGFASTRVDVEQLSASLDFGLQLRNWAEIRLGYTQVRQELDFGGAGGLGRLDPTTAGFRLQAEVDQLDSPFFPRHGFSIGGSLFAAREDLGADERYDLFSAGGIGALSRGDHTLLLLASGGSGLGHDLPVYAEFRLGGFLNLSGLPPGSIQGDAYVQAAGIWLYRLGRLPERAGHGYYVGLSLEAGEAWTYDEQFDLPEVRASGALIFGADTTFGPVYLGYGRGEGGEDSFFLFVGSPFRRDF